MCLVQPIYPDNHNTLVPPSTVPSLEEFADVLTQPIEMILSHSIEHTLDLFLGTSLPNTTSHRIAPREATDMEHTIGELFNSGHIHP